MDNCLLFLSTFIKSYLFNSIKIKRGINLSIYNNNLYIFLIVIYLFI